MTQQHPITPPPELTAKLWREASAGRENYPIGEIFSHGVQLAYAAGADQELEACCKLMEYKFMADSSDLRAARRPQPSEAKQALAKLEDMRNGWIADQGEFDLIRRSLERLQQLEALSNG